MGNWITLTGDDIRLLDTETTIMQNVAPLQDLDSCVLSACNLTRGYIQAAAYTMEAAPSVPPECKDDVIAIARATYLEQEPTGTLLTLIRQKARDMAYAHLRDISKKIAAVTEGILPSGVPDVGTGKWGSNTKIAMRMDFVQPISPPPVP